MRYLGIDYGSKRIGLALSDPEGCIAFPYATVGHGEAVVGVIQKEKVGAIVIGLPLIPGKREPAPARSVRAFAAQLAEQVELPIAFESELYTTKIAERHSAGEKADAAAAALILQSYLDRLNAERRKPKD